MKRMKSLCLAGGLLAMALCNTAHSQESSFIWDQRDSIAKTKSELYSLSKMWISETWKSANDVIQNDDREGGFIAINGIHVASLNNMYATKFYISYTVKLYSKDNKWRISIDNVRCKSSTNTSQMVWPCITLTNVYPPDKAGRRITGMTEKDYNEIVPSLKKSLQLIVNSYSEYLTSASATGSDDGW